METKNILRLSKWSVFDNHPITFVKSQTEILISFFKPILEWWNYINSLCDVKQPLSPNRGYVWYSVTTALKRKNKSKGRKGDWEEKGERKVYKGRLSEKGRETERRDLDLIVLSFAKIRIKKQICDEFYRLKIKPLLVVNVTKQAAKYMKRRWNTILGTVVS